jgi:hypothetical protein
MSKRPAPTLAPNVGLAASRDRDLPEGDPVPSGHLSSIISTPMRIGIDFDNTIVGYDRVFLDTAVREGLLRRDFVGHKQAIRDAIRLLPDGELAWQRLQGIVYGRGIAEAAMFEGVDRFLRRCRDEGHAVFVVSHKTEYGHFDRERTNLRAAAMDWMQRHGFFAAEGYGLSVDNVFFEASRADKLDRIARIGCTHFIDDLEEVLSDPGFPPINRILFSVHGVTGATSLFPTCATWSQVEAEIFGAAG